MESGTFPIIIVAEKSVKIVSRNRINYPRLKFVCIANACERL
jgi:hypothetical protein